MEYTEFRRSYRILVHKLHAKEPDPVPPEELEQRIRELPDGTILTIIPVSREGHDEKEN